MDDYKLENNNTLIIFISEVMKRLFYLTLSLALLYLFLSGVLLTGCREDAGSAKEKQGKQNNQVNQVHSQNVKLELSLKDLVFEADGGKKAFTISCNGKWTIENNSDWCKMDVNSGTGNLGVTVMAETYDGMEDRSVDLMVKSGNKTQVLSVTQKYKDAIVLSKDKFKVPQEGETISVKVKSNIAYTVTIPLSFRSWITQLPSSQTETANAYDFNISENENVESRKGYIILSGNAVKNTIYIYQAPKDYFKLVQNRFTPRSEGEEIVVDLRTNVDYQVEIPDAVSWISLLEDRTLQTNALHFRVESNAGGNVRSVEIVVKDVKGRLSDTLYVTQYGMPGDERDITADFDADFAKVLQDEGYIPDAARIVWADVRYVDTLSIGQKNLISLRGIKYFESLKSLECSYNKLPSLDVSACTSLLSLDCSRNELTSLNVRENAVLTKLKCNNNRLSVLDVSENSALTFLNCRYNLLTVLDVSKSPLLTELKCEGNPGANGIFLLTEDHDFSVEKEWNYNGQTVILRKQREASIGIVELKGDVFSETVADLSFDMIYVKGGTFDMGTAADQESEVNSDELPVHSVTLSDYYIGKFEVTQGLWKAVMGSNPSNFNKGDNYPVENVSWKDIQTFLTKLNELTGKKYVLPTEAQWEYAACGGIRSESYKYSGSNNIGEVAWYSGNSANSTNLVGTKKPNELGIYDMSGNVWEWCSSGDESLSDSVDPLSNTDCVLRGGGWDSFAQGCRVSNRRFSRLGRRYFYRGFRLVLLP